jgi:hypothetical protein
MKLFKPMLSSRAAGSLALALALLSATTARANVYATDIKVNGSSTSITNTTGDTVTITYILNQPATSGVTVNILQGNSVVKTISGGTSMGLNTVYWLPNVTGTFSVSITAGAVGYTNWTKISLDSTNNAIVDPEGLDVDKNTNSSYYGRVMLGNASSGTTNGVTQQCGIYKMNADGSPADEGSFGYGGYTTNDSGGTASGAMNNGGGFNPWRLRIGDDDRLYMLDYSDLGAIIAFDLKVTTNQIVINEGPASTGYPNCSNNYSGNPDFGDLSYGIDNFDVSSTTTSNAAVWLCDVDTPDNWGIWMYHLKNGVADPADTEGTQAVIQSASSSDLSEASSGGCMIDTNLDIFVSQSTFNNDPVFRTMEYTHWNSGVLPPEKGGASYAYGTATNQVHWGVGTSDNTFCGVYDTVLNSRTHPTMVALPMIFNSGGAGTAYGIRVLNATNGSVVSVTNGASIQTLTNIDYANQYTSAAWDNVGNLYGASSSAGYWRVWSPPGSNQATTVAVATVQVTALKTPPDITTIALSGTNVIINFTAGASDVAADFTLIHSGTVNGAYTNVNGAIITGGSGSFQATAAHTNSSPQFYRLER